MDEINTKYQIRDDKDNRKLIKKYLSEKDESTKEEILMSIINGLYPLIYKLALSYADKLASRSNNNYFSDLVNNLVQEGELSIKDAIDRFDLNYTNTFVTYCYSYINISMKNYINQNFRMITIPKEMIRKVIMIRNFRNDYLLEYNKEPSYSKLFDYINSKNTNSKITIKDIELALSQFDSINTSFDENVDILKSLQTNELTPVDYSRNIEINEKLNKAILNLNDEEKIVLEERFLKDKKSTFASIAKKLNCSIEKVRLIEIRIKEKLQKVIE